MPDLPIRARVVVIGGGVVGASVAYHLAAMGCEDVVLLERHQLGSGTTWHAAGNMETFRADPLLGELIAYGLDLFPKLEAESGQDIGWRQLGRVMYSADPDRDDDFRLLPRLGALRGVEMHPLSPREVVERLPIVAETGIRQGVWIPGDGRVNPVDLVNAYGRAARSRGARLEQGVVVEEILTHDGRAVGVRTAQGDIECETVVIASGMWSPQVAATCGVGIPLHAVEHMYLVTQPSPEITADLPMFLSYDERLYGRPEGAGLLIGFFDENAILLPPERLPDDFAFSLMPDNWEQIEANLEVAVKRFPLLEEIEIRKQYNGPESFTPDVRMLLGETPEVDGVFVAAGLNSSGIALAAGAGRLTAEWILDGRPSLDASRLDIRRFGSAQSSLGYRGSRAREAVSYMCRRPALGTGWTSARDVTRSPLHDVMVAAGATMGTAQDWERPLWFGDPDQGLQSISAEIAAARTTSTVVDRSSDVKLRLAGPDAVNIVAELAGGHGDVGTVELLPFRNRWGGTDAMPWIARLDEEEWLLYAEAEQTTWLRAVLERAAAGRDVTLTDETSALATVGLLGPRAEQILSAWSGPEVVLAVGRVRPGAPGRPDAVLLHVEPGPALHVVVPRDHAVRLYDELLTLGSPLGAVPAGSIAEDDAWLRSGIPRIGREAGPSVEIAAEQTLRTFRAPGLDFAAAPGTCPGQRRRPRRPCDHRDAVPRRHPHPGAGTRPGQPGKHCVRRDPGGRPSPRGHRSRDCPVGPLGKGSRWRCMRAGPTS